MKLSSFPFSKQHSLIVLIIAVISIFAFAAEFFINDSVTQVFVYHRNLIAQGEIWRLFTGHLLHTNGYHLLLNLAALVMLWALHGRFYTIKNYCALFTFCAFITSMGIYYGSPSLIQYVGLSGVLHGIFVFGAIMDIAAKDKTGYLLFIGVFMKIAHEQIYGASTDVSDLIEASVAVDAHLWGAIGGLVFTVIYLRFFRFKTITID
ncbi:rhombosortase [Colwellia sp. 4_MG-2023]|uniref:rhombosortase n=1 Tax=unclassified Colwellia TaxID=196834 RepID=UPI0026E41BB5|nr:MULTISPECIES: rhombosortase [unclassified Colwellia]MDO6507060.1 rhombosortase [Colwellia sp. 5_MG-2023]MDO6555894.1 rhombosortase [Colwellia sp. 4_MG-2023]